MLQERVAEIEGRAAAAEATLKTLEAGKQAQAGASDAAVMLPKLLELQKLIAEDKAEADGAKAKAAELKDENERLRAQVDKLNYRVMHLLRTIEQLEGATKK